MTPLQAFGTQFWQRARASPIQRAACVATALVGLTAFVTLDQLVPQSGWWLFVGLSLTTGFLHGALDVVLLGQAFQRPHQSAWAAALYLVSVVLLGALLGQLLALALLTLIVLSAWHFGEPYGRWGANDLLLRTAVGGASVMLPMLLSPIAMRDVVQLLAQGDASLVWNTWRALAYAWVAVVAASALRLALHRSKNMTSVLTELAAVFTLNAVLSPLMAFALYFGAYHALSHVGRVVAAQHTPRLRLLFHPAVFGAVCATAALLGLLWWYLQGWVASQPPDDSAVVRWLVVALAAVTPPHLILVSRCAHWLKTPGPSDAAPPKSG